MNSPADPLPRSSGRITLRRLAPSDLSACQRYRQNSEAGLYQGWEPQSDADAARFLADMSHATIFPPGEWVQLGIADCHTNALIGDVGICVDADGQSAEIGFTVDLAAQGTGRGSEAVRETIALVFERTVVARIVAVTDARNLRSIRLLERVGMRRDATVDAMFRGEPCTEHIYVVERGEV